jgi:DNA-binding LacI/PurR family transcriptional regulator
MKSSGIRSTADLARMLGLSRWTVSRALNGHQDIAPATADRILAEAARLGFAPSLLGRSLRSGRTDLVGVCVPDLEDYFLTNKVSLIQRHLAESGFHVLLQIAESAEEEAAAIRRFASMQCSGWVTMASRLEGDNTLAGLDSDLPVVHVDPLYPKSGAVVKTDRSRAMRLAVRHLHARGCRRLVTAGIDPGGTGYAAERMSGLGAEIRCWRWEKPAHFLESAGADDFETGALAAAELLALPGRGRTGVIALNDRVAFSMAQSLASAEVRIPARVALVGYDDSGLARTTRPALTSIDPHPGKLIQAAAALLLKALVGKSKQERIIIRPSLIPRESS